jgi:hypothetical protein
MSSIPLPASRSAPSTLSSSQRRHGHARPRTEDDAPFSGYHAPHPVMRPAMAMSTSPPSSSSRSGSGGTFLTGAASLGALDALQPSYASSSSNTKRTSTSTSRTPSAPTQSRTSSSGPPKIDMKRLLAKPARPMPMPMSMAAAASSTVSAPSMIVGDTSDASSLVSSHTSYTDVSASASRYAASRYAASSTQSIRSVPNPSPPARERERKPSLPAPHLGPVTPSRRRETLSGSPQQPIRSSAAPISMLPQRTDQSRHQSQIQHQYQHQSNQVEVAVEPSTPTRMSSSGTRSVSSSSLPRPSSSAGPLRPPKSPYRPGHPSLPPSRSPSRSRSVTAAMGTAAVGVAGGASGAATSMPLSAPSPPDLTPAGAVVHAYKEQERRRSVLESMATATTTTASSDLGHGSSFVASPNSPSTFDDSRQSRSRHHRAVTSVAFSPPSRTTEMRDSAAEPYYTVFGATSGRVVAVGGPEADDWGVNPADIRGLRATATVTSVSAASSSSNVASGSGTKSLSRKLSGRITRAVRGDSPARVIPQGTLGVYDDQHQPHTLQERRNTSRGPAPLQVSIENGSNSGHGPRTPNSSRGNGANGFNAGFPPEDVVTPRSSSGRTPDANHGTASASASSPGTGTRLWKLMKRLSTGGLKDKYVGSMGGEDMPPVPALPDEHRRKRMTYDSAPSRKMASGDAPPMPMTMGMGMQTPDRHAKLVKPNANANGGMNGMNGMNMNEFGMRSMVSGAPSPHQTQSQSQSQGTRTSTSTRARHPSGPRTRGATAGTRTSSPVSSSEVGSGMFGRSGSLRSSTSSYGEELARPGPGPAPVPAPAPASHLGHIVPPSRLPELDTSGSARHMDARAARSLDGHFRPTNGIVPPQPSWRASPLPPSRTDDEDERPPRSAVDPPMTSLPPPPRRPRNLSSTPSNGTAFPAARIPSAPIPAPALGLAPAPASPRAFSHGAAASTHGLPRADFGGPADSPITPDSASRMAHGAHGMRTPQRERATSATSRMPRPAVRIPTSSSPSSPASSASPATPGSGIRTPRSAATVRPVGVKLGSGGKGDGSESSPVRFRALDNALLARGAKSEREKAEMWDDLLFRSDKAGGTLHVASEEALMSDAMSTRASTYSELMQ